MYKWELLLFIHIAYDMLITSYAFKTTVANGQSLVFSLQNNLLFKSVMQTITFVSKCLNSNNLERAASQKLLVRDVLGS